MPSESVRATAGTESRFRIQHPNSKPRLVKIIALDGAARALVDEVARLPWSRAVFFTALSFSAQPAAPKGGEPGSLQGWLRDVAGQTKDLIQEIDTADLVVMVSSAGEDAEAALLIGEACAVRRITTIGLVVQGPMTSEEETSRTLKALRPVTGMLVIANGTEYIEAMLAALRA